MPSKQGPRPFFPFFFSDPALQAVPGVSAGQVEALVLAIAGEVTGHSVDAQERVIKGVTFAFSSLLEVLTACCFLFAGVL